MKIENSQISIIKNYFKTKPVLKAFLFGSNARNEANENSDIDLLVELDYSEKIGLQFIQMKFDLEKLLNKSVDLVSSNGISKHIKSNIDKDKTLIYAR
jgi:predicted nucleotidyltransferase